MIKRPITAWTIALTDEELAKVGLLAMLDSQCLMAIGGALKAAAKLDFESWKRLATVPFEQLITRLIDAARLIDRDLLHLAEEVLAGKEVLIRRHQAIHGIWADDRSEGEASTWDVKRDLHLSTAELDDAIAALASYTLVTRLCLVRAAELIRDRVLPGGTGSIGPYYRLKDKFIQL